MRAKILRTFASADSMSAIGFLLTFTTQFYFQLFTAFMNAATPAPISNL